MNIILVLIFAAFAAGLFVLWLAEFRARLADRDAQISKLREIVSSIPHVILEPQAKVDIENPVMATMRPPFAQAALDWEAEDAEKRPPTFAQALGVIEVPPLSEAEKDRIAFNNQ